VFRTQVVHVFKKEMAQLRRNREALRILLIAPFLQMLAFGYAATTDVKDIPYLLVDLDKTPESRALVQRFSGSGLFRLAGAEDGTAEIDRWLERGKADLAIVVPAGYGAGVQSGGRPEVQILADGTDSNSAMRGMSYAAQIVADESRDRFGPPPAETRAASAGVGRVRIEPRVWFNPDLRSRWYMVPAVLAMVLMIVLMTLSSMAIVRERETGTMEQLIVTPLDPKALMLGKLAPYAIVGLAEIAITTAVATLWFRVPLRGSVFDLFGLSFLFVLVTLATGLLVSTVARTQQQAMMASMFFIMTPMIYLSGFLFPIENMPAPIQAITWAVPLRYFALIVRGVFLKGAGLDTLWPNALALAGFAAALWILAARRFRKTLD
jgi:ABC-2 type transport system permease protein